MLQKAPGKQLLVSTSIQQLGRGEICISTILATMVLSNNCPILKFLALPVPDKLTSTQTKAVEDSNQLVIKVTEKD